MFSGNASVDFPEFLKMMEKRVRHADAENEVKEAFKVFDKVSEHIIVQRKKNNAINVSFHTQLSYH